MATPTNQKWIKTLYNLLYNEKNIVFIVLSICLQDYWIVLEVNFKLWLFIMKKADY